MSATSDQVREFWDLDAATYDRSASHHPGTEPELAAWRGALRQLLPAPAAAVLDVGAGTGFLTLLLAGLGYRVTALDLSPRMLAQLRAKATARGYDVHIVEGDAGNPPVGEFDVVVERHLLWTLPRPENALRAWRAVAPAGRLVLVESMWGAAAGPGEVARGWGRAALAQLRRQAPAHHGEYEADLRAALPLGRGARVQQLLDLVAASDWRAPRLHRLSDIEWTTRTALLLPERLLGTTPRYAILAGR